MGEKEKETETERVQKVPKVFKIGNGMTTLCWVVNTHRCRRQTAPCRCSRHALHQGRSARMCGGPVKKRRGCGVGIFDRSKTEKERKKQTEKTTEDSKERDCVP